MNIDHGEFLAYQISNGPYEEDYSNAMAYEMALWVWHETDGRPYPLYIDARDALNRTFEDDVREARLYLFDRQYLRLGTSAAMRLSLWLERHCAERWCSPEDAPQMIPDSSLIWSRGGGCEDSSPDAHDYRRIRRKDDSRSVWERLNRDTALRGDFASSLEELADKVTLNNYQARADLDIVDTIPEAYASREHAEAVRLAIEMDPARLRERLQAARHDAASVLRRTRARFPTGEGRWSDIVFEIAAQLGKTPEAIAIASAYYFFGNDPRLSEDISPTMVFRIWGAKLDTRRNRIRTLRAARKFGLSVVDLAEMGARKIDEHFVEMCDEAADTCADTLIWNFYDDLPSCDRQVINEAKRRFGMTEQQIAIAHAAMKIHGLTDQESCDWCAKHEHGYFTGRLRKLGAYLPSTRERTAEVARRSGQSIAELAVAGARRLSWMADQAGFDGVGR